MSRPLKSEIRAALKVHTEALANLKDALTADNGERIATYLEASSCAFETFEKLCVERYPDEFESDEEEGEGEVVIDEEDDEEEEEENDEDPE